MIASQKGRGTTNLYGIASQKGHDVEVVESMLRSHAADDKALR